MSILSKLINFPQSYLNKKVSVKVESNLRSIGFIPIMETEEQDIFIIGYPKSGNTWMQYMMSSIVYGIDPFFLNNSLVLEFVPDVYYKRFYKRYKEKCFFKSHDLPTKKFKKVIYLVRDGRDVMVSYYHMNRIQFKKYSLNEMISEGKGLSFGHWHEHVHAWKANPFDAEVIIVKYEDLKSDTLEVMKKVCKFSNIEIDDDRLKKVIEGCSFDKLKDKEMQGAFNDTTMLWKGDNNKRFFRKGEVGSYKNDMNDDLIRKFEAISKVQLKEYGYID